MLITGNRLLLVVSVLLAIAFAVSGLATLSGAMNDNFERFGYPQWFMYLVGAAEVAGAVGLFPRRTAFYASACLGILMLGAVGTHLMNDPPRQALAALVLLVLCGAAAYMNRLAAGRTKH